jgi:hypothetical protein
LDFKRQSFITDNLEEMGKEKSWISFTATGSNMPFYIVGMVVSYSLPV